MTIPTRDVELVEAGTLAVPTPPQPAASSDIVLMFERLATNKDVDVEKLERLIAMQERLLKHQAKADFDAAFSRMQGELPEISEHGRIIVGSGDQQELRSTYATNEDIQRAVKPILQKHGFSIRFRNEWLDGNKLKVVGILSHESGHSEQDEFVAAADTSGSKNAIQAIASTRSYGQRYTTTALLNIATRGADDDGQSSEKFKAAPAPDGYDDWLTDLAAVSDEGTPKLSAAWNKAPKHYRKHLLDTDASAWERLKIRAAKVKAQA